MNSSVTAIPVAMSSSEPSVPKTTSVFIDDMLFSAISGDASDATNQSIDANGSLPMVNLVEAYADIDDIEPGFYNGEEWQIPKSRDEVSAEGKKNTASESGVSDVTERLIGVTDLLTLDDVMKLLAHKLQSTNGESDEPKPAVGQMYKQKIYCECGNQCDLVANRECPREQCQGADQILFNTSVLDRLSALEQQFRGFSAENQKLKKACSEVEKQRDRLMTIIRQAALCDAHSFPFGQPQDTIRPVEPTAAVKPKVAIPPKTTLEQWNNNCESQNASKIHQLKQQQQQQNNQLSLLLQQQQQHHRSRCPFLNGNNSFQCQQRNNLASTTGLPEHLISMCPFFRANVQPSLFAPLPGQYAGAARAQFFY